MSINNPTTEQISALPYIIAVDFDGTLVKDEFPNIGYWYNNMVEQVLKAKNKGIKVILWTCRTGDKLTEALEKCKEKGITFDAINDNLSEVKALGWDARKVYANEYWDDRSRAVIRRNDVFDSYEDFPTEVMLI